jgi:hypothetical protein
MEILDLSKCKSNKEVTSAIQDRVVSVGLESLVNQLSSSFVFHEVPTKKIYTALSTGNNAILHGPGGFGKSVLVKAICEILGLPVTYKIGYKGMMPDELFGVPNMKALLEESRYETAFENSLFSKPSILILEEFLDCDPSTAAALKDILTDKGFREGDSRKESLIASVIITGNKDPDSLSKESDDESLAAFYLERFPFRHNMKWNRFREEDYMSFFRVYYPELYDKKYMEFTFVSRLCANTDKTVSPRVATQAADVALKLGVDYLDTLSGIDTKLISDIKYQVENEKSQTREAKILSNVESEIIECINSLRSKDISKTMNSKARLEIVKVKLEGLEISNDSFIRLQEVNTLLNHGLQQAENNLLDNIDTNIINNDINKLFKDAEES